MTKIDDKDMHTLELITHEVGLLEMEDGRSSPDDRRWARDLAASWHQRIAEYQLGRAATVPVKKAPPITKRLLAMPRNVLETLFAALVERCGGQLQVAHRHLDELSDNDLRRLIQTIESRAKGR